MPGVDWGSVLEALEGQGWTARVLPVERVRDARERVTESLESGELPAGTAAHLAGEAAVSLPSRVARPRSVIIAATARPLTRAVLTVAGEERSVAVPPHYAGYHTRPRRLEEALGAQPALQAYRVALCAAPLKALAAGAGLARYGRNNVTYVPGLGSYLLLAACVSDAPPPQDCDWGEAPLLKRCHHCIACARACPTAAIGGDRFLLHTERCLTLLNESEAPFPSWVDQAWHSCAVGCLRCQQACPENAAVALRVEPPERFDAAETAAVLAGDQATLPPPALAKLARCGLDYSAPLIARNLRALFGV